MLSAITSTVTVAPLTMSGCGGKLLSGRHGSDPRTDELVDRFDHTTFRHADQHDGFLVLDELRPCDDAFRIDANEHLHRLPGVADAAGKIGVQVNIAEQTVGCVNGENWRIPSLLPVTRPFREEFFRCCLRSEFLQP